jgi:cyclopropane fatty-acyl-phospholipid synthase-like methyltransferase
VFHELSEALARPEAFSLYTVQDMWDDTHVSQQMLTYHLNPDVDISSRRASFIASSSDWMIEAFQLVEGKRVLDLGCGPGLYSSRLAAAGASVVGVDFSRNSIEYARAEAEKQALNVDYRYSNYLEDDLPPGQDLVMIAMCDFCALGPKERGRLLGKVRDALASGGVFLFDAYSLTAFEAREEFGQISQNLMDGFWSPDPYVGILRTMKYPSEKVVLDRYLIIEEERSRSFFNWLQYFSPDQLEKEIVEAGLVLAELLGDIGGGPFDERASEFAAVVRCE